MIPRLRPLLGFEEYAAAFFGGADVAAFERAFAERAEQAHAIAFPYGRSALMILLKALGVAGRNVITPAYTCIVVPHAIVYAGARPCFIDNGPDDRNMDLDAAEAACAADTGAVIATSFFGYPVNLDRLDGLREKRPDVPIIQDCAHSFFAEWRGRPVHKEGVAAIFGLNFSKLMTSIFGGMTTTDDPSLAAEIRRLRDEEMRKPTIIREARRLAYLVAGGGALSPFGFPLVRQIQKTGLINQFTEYYDENLIDMPADYLTRMGRAEANVGVVQTRKYDVIVARRRGNAALYNDLLDGAPGIVLPPLVEGATYAYYAAEAEAREAIIVEAGRRGVELGRVCEYSVPSLAAYRDYVRHGESFPRAEAAARRALNLPLHGSERAVRRVAAIVRAVLEEIGRDDAVGADRQGQAA